MLTATVLPMYCYMTSLEGSLFADDICKDEVKSVRGSKIARATISRKNRIQSFVRSLRQGKCGTGLIVIYT